MDPPQALLARLTRVLATTEPHDALSSRLCLAFSQLLDADGGSITVGFGQADRVLLCSTDASAGRIEDAQDVLREGPSLDAFRTSAAVTGLTRAQQRTAWPLLWEMLATQGPDHTLHAFPMRPDAAVFGVIMVYRDRDNGLAVTGDEAQFLADAVGVALLGDLGSGSLSEETWSKRDRIDQATGMVVAQLKVRPSDALAVMRAHAFAHATTVAEVSELILARTLDFKDQDSSDGTAP